MQERKMTGFRWFTLVMRWIMEAGVVLGLIYWGVRAGSSVEMKILLAVIAPAVVFGFWGLVDFRWIGRPAEFLRLVQELAITGVVAVALFLVGSPVLGLVLAGLSILQHSFVYIAGDRLLKERR